MILRKLLILTVLIICPLLGWAAVSQPQQFGSEEFNATYTLDLKECHIVFKSLAGGSTGLNPGESRVGYYFHENFRKNFDIDHFELSCVNKAANEMCPDLLKIDKNGILPFSTQRVQKRYRNINPEYRGEALDVMAMAMRPPRARQVFFCLGDNKRTLSGYAWVGNERRHYVDDVLKILASMRFIDASQTVPVR